MGISRSTDCVVKKATLIGEEFMEITDVLLHPLAANMFKHADGADGIERSVMHIAVVLNADFDEVTETSFGDSLTSEFGLFH